MTQGVSPSRSFFRFVLSLLLVVLTTVILIAGFSFLDFFNLYERPDLDLIQGKSFENTAIYKNYIQENLWEIVPQYKNVFLDPYNRSKEAETLEELLLPGHTAIALDKPLLTSAGRIDYYQPLPKDDYYGGRDLDAVIYHQAGRIIFSHLPWEELKPLLRTMEFDAAVSVRSDSGGRHLSLHETTNSFLTWGHPQWIEDLLSRSIASEDLVRVMPSLEEWLEDNDRFLHEDPLYAEEFVQVIGEPLDMSRNVHGNYLLEDFTFPEMEEMGILNLTGDYYSNVKLRVNGFIHLLPNEELRAEPGSIYRLWTEKHSLASRFLTSSTVLVLALVFLGILLLFVYVTLQAGLKPDGTYQTAIIDRIPHEIILACLALIVFLSFISAERFFHNLPFPRGWEFNVGIVLGVFVILSALLAYWLTFIRRLRTGTFIQSSWILSMFRYLWNTLVRGIRRLQRNTVRVQIVFFVLSVFVGYSIALYLSRSQITAFFLVLIAVSIYTLYHLNGLGVIRSEVDDLLVHPADQVEKSHVPPHYSVLQDNIYRLAEAQNLAAQEQIRAERLKAELITNVSHDLRTPLTSLVSYTQLLQQHDELTEEEQAEYLAIVVEKIKLLRQITENLLDISRVSSGNQIIQLEAMDLTEFMRQVWAEHEAIFEDKDLQLILEITGGGQSESFDAHEWARALKEESPEEPVAPEPVIVLADPQSLQRVMLNLFDNALKYALEGSRVFFSLNADDERAEISLRNISRERLRRRGDELLERFVREESSRTSEGSGLGLAIAQSLSDAMGADFTLRLEDDRFEASLSLERFVEGPVEEV